MSKRTLTESGEWRDGAAAPRLLPEPLRKLPAEFVTTDVDDPDKAHELDAPHVVSGVIKDYAYKDAGEREEKTPRWASKKLRAPGPGERAPVTQWYVDVARMRVLATLVGRACAQFEVGLPADLDVKHLWFPDPRNSNEYELRSGAAPTKRERPKYLREMELDVDVCNPPRKVLSLLKEMGVDFDTVKIFEESQRRFEEEMRDREQQQLAHVYQPY